MAIAKGSAHFGHEKQMTGNQYIAKCAKVAVRQGETEEQFVAQFAERFKDAARKAFLMLEPSPADKDGESK